MEYHKPHVGTCKRCKYEDDLRPYGPHNENMCFDCAMRDPEIPYDHIREILEGSPS